MYAFIHILGYLCDNTVLIFSWHCSMQNTLTYYPTDLAWPCMVQVAKNGSQLWIESCDSTRGEKPK